MHIINSVVNSLHIVHPLDHLPIYEAHSFLVFFERLVHHFLDLLFVRFEIVGLRLHRKLAGLGRKSLKLVGFGDDEALARSLGRETYSALRQIRRGLSAPKWQLRARSRVENRLLVRWASIESF